MPEEPRNENTKIIYICENCSVEKVLEQQEAYKEGWDYPPFMGEWGIVSPRTCGDCGIDTTLWWRIMLHNNASSEPFEMTDEDKVLFQRIMNEPESVTPKESDG